MNSRQKGARGERELRDIFRGWGYTDARRGQQYCGASGDADVIGLPDIHVECKRVERLDLYGAVTQAVSDARAGEMPAVFHRRDRREWLVTMPIEEWRKLYEAYELMQETKKGTE